MDETTQVVAVLDELVGAVTETVTVSVSDVARDGLNRLRCALEAQDIETLLATDRHDVLAAPPTGLTDPEEFKYFELLRDSFTTKNIQMPGSQRTPNAARAHGACAPPPFPTDAPPSAARVEHARGAGARAAASRSP